MSLENRPVLSPQEGLPPVEPPSLGLIVRLFLVPLGIVAVVVLVVWGVHYLATSSWDPEAYLAELEQQGPNRWQVAYDFAQLVRRSDVRTNAQVAQRLGQILLAQLEDPPPEESAERFQTEANFRIYLVKALGEFSVPEGFPALLQAARLGRNEPERQVQMAAVEAVATLTFHVLQSGRTVPEEVITTLLELSRHQDPRLRTRAAFALGVLDQTASAEVLDRLEQMLDDPVVDVRYNAAVALARYGRSEAVPTLVEMLQPQQPEAVELEKDPAGKTIKVARIHITALQAALLLAKQNPQADLSPLVAPAEKLAQASQTPAKIRIRARELLNVLHDRASRE